MKKIFGLFAVVLVLSSCVSKVVSPLGGCEKSLTKYLDATSAFFSDPTSKSKCEAFKSGASGYLKGCPALTAAEIKDANQSIKDINCNDL